MDEALRKSGEYPNIALIPGTHTHAATGEQIEQPENTRIGHPRGACRPDNADCDSEPAAVENRPQDGAECDTREQLEADMERLIEDAMGYGWKQQPRISADAIELLERQAAISERELCAKCEWPSLAAMPDIEQQKRIAEQDRRIVEYAEQVDSLTAERDDLRDRLKTQANSFQKLERDNAKLRDTLARVQELVGDAE